MADETPDLITIDEAADLLGVTRQTLKDWRYFGRGPDFVRLGHRTIRYDRAYLLRWIEDVTISGSAT